MSRIRSTNRTRKTKGNHRSAQTQDYGLFQSNAANAWNAGNRSNGNGSYGYLKKSETKKAIFSSL